MILTSSESQWNALHSGVLQVSYPTAVTIGTWGKRKLPQNSICDSTIVNQTSYRTPPTSEPIYSKKWPPCCEVVRRYFSGRCGVHNPSHSRQYGDYRSPTCYFAECVPTLTDRCTLSSPQTFTSAYARRLWRFLRDVSIRYGCLIPKTLIFPPISHFAHCDPYMSAKKRQILMSMVSNGPVQYAQQHLIPMCT